MSIKFGNIGVSGIVYSNNSSVLSDISGVAVVNSGGQLVEIISLPQSFAKMKSEGSRIAGFDMRLVSNGTVLPFFKSVSGESIDLNRSEIAEIFAFSPSHFLIESNQYSVDLDTNSPINFKFYYPFNAEKLYPERNLISSYISSLLYFASQQEEYSSTNIENAFGFDINNFITPSGDDYFVASGNNLNAIEASKRIAALVEITTNTIVSGVDPSGCYQALAEYVTQEETPRSGVKTFFEDNTSGIILSSIVSASGYTDINDIPSGLLTKAINLAENINYISDIDIANYGSGNIVSTIVLVDNLLNNESIDLTDNNSEIATELETAVTTIIETNTSGTTTTTTTTQEPYYSYYIEPSNQIEEDIEL